MIALGGNKLFYENVKHCLIGDAPIKDKYKRKEVKMYKKKLVCEVMGKPASAG